MKAVGVSNYGPRQLEKMHTYLTERGVPVASAQVCPGVQHTNGLNKLQYAAELVLLVLNRCSFPC